MFWTPGPFPSFILSLNSQRGRVIQQPSQLYTGLCNVCLFLSIARAVTLVAVRVSGNNQWIPSQNKGANVVPSSWVNKQLLNKIFSTALHVCVNIVFPPWVIWSAALQLHGRGHLLPTALCWRLKFCDRIYHSGFPVSHRSCIFLAGLEKKVRLEEPDGHIWGGKKAMKQMLLVLVSVSIS